MTILGNLIMRLLDRLCGAGVQADWDDLGDREVERNG
jgi:hypothetical protein